MAVIALRKSRTRAGFGVIVTPGSSTYPSQDGTFTIVRGSGEHWGNGLIDGWIIGGTSADGYYEMDDNNTGSGVSDQTVGRRYKVGSEYDTFVNSSESSPEYIAYEIALRQQQETANPRLKEYDDALRAWAVSQQPPVNVDPVYGFATGFDISTAPADVQKAYADFTGNPIPEPPPPPAGPAEYLQGGITFDDAGNVYGSDGKPISGVQLTPAEVASLKATGSLPAGDSGPPGLPGYKPPPASSSSSSGSSSSSSSSSSAPPPATSSSAPPAQTGGTSDGTQPATSSGGGSSTLNLPAGTSAVDVTTGSPPAVSVAPAAATTAAASSGLPWGMIGLVAAGVVGAVVLTRGKGKGRRR